MTYKFRREDNGDIIEVDFATAMSQSGGFITLPDGASARRCVYLENHDDYRSEKREKVQAEIVSDTLGVTANAVADYRANAAKHGYHIEFTPDPTSPYFYQARFPSWQEKARYAKFRGLGADRNSKNGSGAALSPAQFERAKQRLLESSK